MENFRSMSTREGRMQMESYHGDGSNPTNMHDLRSYSTSYVSSVQPPHMGKEVIKIKKGKSSVGPALKSWSFNDPELQRKKRVVGYKVYGVEGKMKGSLRKSFRWIKDTFNGLW
ncbi:unnamed protein product [Ilex paraguariensis]|uniref:DUF3511 domain protein n=1 Tax=Ilex paraguariensis TaxID=185542 RepID=A0ABC8TWG4_9AQUA